MNKGFFIGASIVIILIVTVSLILNWKTSPITPNLNITQSTPLPSSLSESDSIRITSPQPGQIVTSPLRITGEAPGTWYFEASFPIHLQDATGKTLVSTTASAQSDWMTTSLVPFQAQLTIPATFSGPATLVFAKDNPSDLPANAGSVQIPITVSAK